MQNNPFLKRSFVVLTILGLIGGSFYGGVVVGQHTPKKLVVQGATNIFPTGSAAAADFGTFWQAWQAINDIYLRNGDIKNEDKVRGAMRGLVASLGDPYTQYFDPVDGQKFQEDVQGNFGGVGIEIGVRKNVLTVIAPLKSSPAEKAGIRSQDLIVAIDDKITEGTEIEDAVSRIRGEIGSTVKLSILREGWDKPKDFLLTRDRISVPTLKYEMKPGGIAYIQIYSFNGNVDEQFYTAARQAIAAGAKGIVLDLRGNPGGYLDVAVDVAGWFLKKGQVVVSEESRQGKESEMRAQGNEAFLKLPIVVLINKGSASASEILAGALRDQRHAPLVGEQSFGKGTVQQIKDLADGSTIKITVAHWVLPSGEIIDHEGLKPDVEIKLTDSDIEKNRDPQLDKALEIITSKIH